MNNDIYVGIDTSAYTSSLAISDNKGNIIYKYSKILDVKQGACGLRQSDALFAHIKNFENLFETENISDYGMIKAVCVSDKPRNTEGSYMPVFLAGKLIADTIGSSNNIPVIHTSHQNGHLYACMITNPIPDGNFIAVHMSGGTSEILNVSPDKNDYIIKIIGGTKDISAGKLIDRIGVRAGLGFPAGNSFENKASLSENNLRFKISVKDTYFNFSGIESLAEKALESSDVPDVFFSVECAVADTLSESILNACRLCSLDTVYMFGGVICNTHIKKSLKYALGKNNINVFFADKYYSGDNACGLAYHAYHINNGK